MGNIPTITKNLLIINVLAFAATLVLQGSMGIDLNNISGFTFSERPILGFTNS